MKVSWLALAAIGGILAGTLGASPGFAEETVAWGYPQHDVRIGITTSSTSPDPAIKVLFENVGPTEQTVLIGHILGIGPVYFLQFTATSPDGEEFKLQNAGPGGVAGTMSRLGIRLAPGTIQEVSIDMSKIFMNLAEGKQRSLNAIIHLHYSVNVSLEVNQAAVDSAIKASTMAVRGQNFWTGKMTSGKFRTSE